MFKNLIYSILACGLFFASASASAAVFDLRANIDGAQANAGAGTGSPATGLGIMTYNDVTGILTWTVSWENDLLLEPVTVAHFHGPAAPGANAGVQVDIDVRDPIDPSIIINPTSGTAELDVLPGTTQGADLLAGLWYINIHSERWPGGEIRGQVQVVPIPAAAWLFGSGLLILVGFLRKRS